MNNRHQYNIQEASHQKTLNQFMGAFIAIDGPDIEQTKKQAKLLKKKLQSQKHRVLLLNFPLVDQNSGYFVNQYLTDNYSNNNPYISAMFFMLDRFDQSVKVSQFINSGGIVIATQYSASTMVQQGVRLKTQEQRRGFNLWLDNFEHESFKTPRADKNFVIIPEIDQFKQNESSIDAFKDVCNLFPKDYERVDLRRGQKLLDDEELQNYIWERVKPLLPARKIQKSKPNILEDVQISYKIPTVLDTKNQNQFKQYIDTILDCRRVILQKLISSDIKSDKAKDVSDLLIPIIALNDKDRLLPTNNIKKIAGKLGNIYSDNNVTLAKLVNYTPKNELSITPEILYTTTALSLDDIKLQTEKWSYKRKEKLLLTYLNNDSSKELLKNITYEWEVFTTTKTLIELKKLGFGVAFQEFTPRYGYDIPSIIEENNLSDIWDTCFDLSLEINSMLTKDDHKNLAPYVTLLGHKNRAVVSHSALEVIFMKEILKKYTNNDLYNITSSMIDQISEKHPLITSNI